MLLNGSAGFWQLVEVRVRRDEGKQPAEGKEGSGEGTGRNATIALLVDSTSP